MLHVEQGGWARTDFNHFLEALVDKRPARAWLANLLRGPYPTLTVIVVTGLVSLVLGPSVAPGSWTPRPSFVTTAIVWILEAEQRAPTTWSCDVYLAAPGSWRRPR